MLDPTDQELLKLLQADGKMTTKELSQAVSLSHTPTFERIKRLEANGYIKKYVAVLDPDKLDCSLTVFCNVTLQQHSKDIGHQFVKDIQEVKEVIECYNVSGDYDFLLKVMVKDMKHYQDFVLNRLGMINSIGSVHSTFSMCEIKNTNGIPL